MTKTSEGLKLKILASWAALLLRLAVMLSTIKLRQQQQEANRQTFKIPGGLLIPFTGIATITRLLTSLSKPEIISTTIFFAFIGSSYFLVRKWQKQMISTTIVSKLII